VELNPDSAHAQNDLAWLLVTSGRAREARPFADRALDLAPWEPGIVDTLAAVAMGIGQCKAAVQLERRAADLVPVSANEKSVFGNRLAEYESKCGAGAAK
jgi:Flp pilus assembly protein TadD